MTVTAASEWTIGELGEQVVSALSVGYDGPSNGQVRAVPDRRSIRYYTSLGLLDRPLFMRGRTALYGRRHLQQLVAIKRLQARGLSLAEIQTKLAGATSRQLTALSHVSPRSRGRSAPSPDRGDFWRASPAPKSSEQPSPKPPEQPSPKSPEQPSPKSSQQPSRTDPLMPTSVLRFQLAPGVCLLVDAARDASAEDGAAIAAAARQLLDQLDKRGLVPTA